MCDGSEELCLEPPAVGVQVRSLGETIAAGEDVEYCEIVALPGTADDVYYVNRFESKMTGSSHHLIVTAIPVGSTADQNLEVGYKQKCTGAREVAGEDRLPVTGSQQPYHEEAYPPGVGRVFYGGQKLVFDYHYLNTTDAPILAQAVVNMHTTDEANVEHIARSFGFYNLGINTPPGETASFTTACSFSADIGVHKLTRHTHQWGTDFTAWHAGGARDGEQIWTTPGYEVDVEHVFDSPITVRSGEGFTFECSFDNTTTEPLTFGVKASDEMCILFGTWWPVDESQTVDSQSCYNF